MVYLIHNSIGQLWLGCNKKKNWFYQFVVRMSREKMRQINMMQERQNPQLPNLLIDIKKKEKIVQ